MALPRKLTVSQWAERHRILGNESPIPGRWKNRQAPYLVEPMDAFTDPAVERIVLCFAAQCGKTEFELNCLGYIIDEDPGTIIFVYDCERQADRVMRRRVHPMILNSPALRRHLLGNSDDLGLKELTFDRCFLQTAWSNSPGALASFPCRYAILDECDKYPPYAGREANPIELAAVRTRTFRGRRKILVVSTPTLETHYTWSEYQRSNQCRYCVPCPHCGRYQHLEFFKLTWDKTVHPHEIEEQGLAWYVCEKCGEKILDEHKGRMLELGRWVPKGMTIDDQGELHGTPPSRRISGYQLSALYSPFVSFGEMASKWIQGIGDLGLMMSFFNSWLGLPWQEKIESVTEKKILNARRDYPAGVVPREARKLVAGVDVQADHFWYVVRAWGVGEKSWLIRYGTVQTWDQVWEVLSAGYPVEGGAKMGIERALVDSGFHTSEVYDFCREHYPITLPTKGSNNPALVSSVKMGKPAVGVVLFTFKADYYKDKLAHYIGVRAGNPGEWMIHREIEEDPYIRHMTAERRAIERKQGRRYSTWKPLTESTPNHLWDCEVLCVLAADQLGVRFLAEQAQAPAPAPRRTERRSDEGWLDQDRDWLRGEGSIWDG